MRLIVLGLVTSLAFAAPASGQTTNPAAAESKEKPAKAEKVCRAIQVTGQRIPRRECKTEAEWAAVDAGDGMEALRLRVDTPRGN